jgi:hypothetical protein
MSNKLEDKHFKFNKYCELVISMSVDAIQEKLTYNTYITNLEGISKRMKEEFYIKVIDSNVDC